MKLFILLLLWLAPISVEASEGGHSGFSWDSNGVYIAVFLLVMVPLIWKIAPTVRRFYAERRERVKKDIEEANAAFIAAEERLRAAENRLAGIKAEIEALSAEFRRLGEAERDSLAREAEDIKAKLSEEAAFRVRQAARMAKAEMTEALVIRALDEVERRVQAHARQPVHDAVINRLVEGIQ